jgi:hypothetical protein
MSVKKVMSELGLRVYLRFNAEKKTKQNKKPKQGEIRREVQARVGRRVE